MGRKKEFSVDEALGRAIGIFWERGFEGASVEELTHAMGIQRASLYGTFGDKRALYHSALAAYQRNGLARMTDLLADPVDPVEAIRQVLLTVIPEEPGPHVGCFCMNAAVERAPCDGEVIQMIERHFSRVTAMLARVIAAGQSQQRFRLDMNPMEAGGFVLDSLNGLHVAAKAGADPEALRRKADFVVACLLEPA